MPVEPAKAASEASEPQQVTLSTSGRKTRPLYTRVAIAGLLLYALVTLAFAVLSQGEASTVGVFIISIVLSVIFGGLMWRFGKWALVPAALWGFLNLWWEWLPILALSYPNSFFDFVLPLLLTVGVLLAVVGAIVAFVQQSRERLPDNSIRSFQGGGCWSRYESFSLTSTPSSARVSAL